MVLANRHRDRRTELSRRRKTKYRPGRARKLGLPYSDHIYVPHDFLAVEIFAKGFNKAGNVVGQKSLPYQGVTALNEAMYGKHK